jgi:hypothetical protein
MLFDLRAPGRKRAVQAVYVVLAVVLIGGTILFGVGTNGPGLFSSDNNNPDQTSLSDQNKERLDQLTAQVRRNPKDAAAWGSIASLRFATGSTLIPETATAATPEAKAEFEKAAVAWNRYVALNPDPIDIQVASRMASAFGPDNLNQPGNWANAQGLATQAQEDKAERDGTKVPVDTYVALLQAQFAAKRSARLTDITEGKLRALWPKSQLKSLAPTIALAKNPNDTKAQEALQAASGAGTQPGGTVTRPEATTTSGATTTAP